MAGITIVESLITQIGFNVFRYWTKTETAELNFKSLSESLNNLLMKILFKYLCNVCLVMPQGCVFVYLFFVFVPVWGKKTLLVWIL